MAAMANKALCGCDQETLLGDAAMKEKYNDKVTVMSYCLVCSAMDPNVQVMVGAHPRKASAAESAVIAKAAGEKEIMAQAVSAAKAKAEQLAGEHEEAVQTMQLIKALLTAKYGAAANSLVVNVKAWDPLLMMKLLRAQALVSNQEVARMLSGVNAIKKATAANPLPWVSTDLAFFLAKVGGDRKSAEVGAIEVPDPVVGVDATKRGVVQTYIKSVVDAFKKVCSLQIVDWVESIHQYAMLLKLLADLPADDAAQPLENEDALLRRAADKFHLIARNTCYLISAYSPVLTKDQALTLCSNMFSELVGQVNTTLNPMERLLALNVGFDGPLFKILTEAAQRYRNQAWDDAQVSQAAGGKRSAPSDASKSAPKVTKTAAKSSPPAPPFQARTTRELSLGESKPHLDSKATAMAAGRTGPKGPLFCNEFKNGKCDRGDACGNFHLCWHCWARLQSPYEDCIHKYDDCPHKAQFSRDPPPKPSRRSE